MSRFMILSLIILINTSSIFLKTTATPSPKYQNYKAYIKTACSSTTYPTICYTLSSYSSTIKSNPIKLCTTSLNLNVKSANKATLTVSNLLKKAKAASSPEATILKDCLEEMKDTVDELKQAVAEMKNLKGGGGESMEEHLKNVRTWVSSALTDEGTCTDGFDDEEMNVNNLETKKKVKKAVLELSRVTSNTLALITNYPSY